MADPSIFPLSVTVQDCVRKLKLPYPRRTLEGVRQSDDSSVDVCIVRDACFDHRAGNIPSAAQSQILIEDDDNNGVVVLASYRRKGSALVVSVAHSLNLELFGSRIDVPACLTGDCPLTFVVLGDKLFGDVGNRIVRTAYD